MPLCEVILKTKIMNFEKYTPKSFSNQLASVCKTSRTIWISFSLQTVQKKYSVEVKLLRQIHNQALHYIRNVHIRTFKMLFKGQINIIIENMFEFHV